MFVIKYFKCWMEWNVKRQKFNFGCIGNYSLEKIFIWVYCSNIVEKDGECDRREYYLMRRRCYVFG